MLPTELDKQKSNRYLLKNSAQTGLTIGTVDALFGGLKKLGLVHSTTSVSEEMNFMLLRPIVTLSSPLLVIGLWGFICDAQDEPKQDEPKQIQPKDDEPKRRDRWEYARLTIERSAYNGRGWGIVIFFDCQSIPEKKGRHVEYEKPSVARENSDNFHPDKHLPEIDSNRALSKWYRNFTGVQYPSRYRSSRSLIPLFDAIGDLGWEQTSTEDDRIERDNEALHVVRTYVFKRKKH